MQELTKRVEEQLGHLHLGYMLENYELLAREAAEKEWQRLSGAHYRTRRHAHLREWSPPDLRHTNPLLL